MQFLSNLSKIGPRQKTADAISFFLLQVKVKKSKKLIKVIKIEEVQIHIF